MIYFNKIFIATILCLIFVLFSVGCASGFGEAEEIESSAAEPVGEALATVEPTSAPEVEPSPTEPEPAASPTPQITEQTDSNNVLVTLTPDGSGGESDNVVGTYIETNDDDFYMAVSYVLDEEAADLSQDMKRIIVTASLGNESADTVVIGDDTLTLIDESGNRYVPNIYATADMNPELIGTELGPNEEVYGFVAFDIPSDANSVYLEWCLSGTTACERPLHAPIP